MISLLSSRKVTVGRDVQQKKRSPIGYVVKLETGVEKSNN